MKNSTTGSIVAEVVVMAAVIGGVYITTKAFKGIKTKISARKSA